MNGLCNNCPWFIVDFLRSKFPYRLLYNINKDNIDSFLSGWADNKIRALIFENRKTPRLRYLLVALHHRDRVVFGFVQVLLYDVIKSNLHLIPRNIN